MKKLFAFLLVLTMCLALCACDVDAILDGVGDMLDSDDGDSGRTQENIVFDQMVPAGDSDVSGGGFFYGGEGNAYVVVDENGNVVSGGGDVTVEIVDGILHINGEAVDMDIVENEDGSYSIITGGTISSEEEE